MYALFYLSSVTQPHSMGQSARRIQVESDETYARILQDIEEKKYHFVKYQSLFFLSLIMLRSWRKQDKDNNCNNHNHNYNNHNNHNHNNIGVLLELCAALPILLLIIVNFHSVCIIFHLRKNQVITTLFSSIFFPYFRWKVTRHKTISVLTRYCISSILLRIRNLLKLLQELSQLEDVCTGLSEEQIRLVLQKEPVTPSMENSKYVRIFSSVKCKLEIALLSNVRFANKLLVVISCIQALFICLIQVPNLFR